MSIDYYRLRELLADTERGDFINRDSAHNHLGAIAPDIARELLRLRDGVKQLADDFGANAEYAPNTHAHTTYIEAEQRLTDLLEGDTK